MLHDTVEGCDKVTVELLRTVVFSDEIVSVVDAISRRPGEPYLEAYIPLQ